MKLKFNRPELWEWHRWFAWHPVWWREAGPWGRRTLKFCWLCKIERKRSTRLRAHARGVYTARCWEYREIETMVIA